MGCEESKTSDDTTELTVSQAGQPGQGHSKQFPPPFCVWLYHVGKVYWSNDFTGEGAHNCLLGWMNRVEKLDPKLNPATASIATDTWAGGIDKGEVVWTSGLNSPEYGEETKEAWKKLLHKLHWKERFPVSGVQKLFPDWYPETKEEETFTYVKHYRAPKGGGGRRYEAELSEEEKENQRAECERLIAGMRKKFFKLSEEEKKKDANFEKRRSVPNDYKQIVNEALQSRYAWVEVNFTPEQTAWMNQNPKIRYMLF